MNEELERTRPKVERLTAEDMDRKNGELIEGREGKKRKAEGEE